MAIQTTYSENLDAARAGLLKGSDYNTGDGVVETAAGIGFGKAVSIGTDDEGVVLGGTMQKFLGVSVRDVSLIESDSDKYAQYKNIAYAKRGEVYVTVAEDVAAGNDVYFSGTDGSWGDTSGSGKLGPVLGARWLTSASSGALALLSLPGYAQT